MSDLRSATAELAIGRPAFIADIVAVYYEPRILMEHPTKQLSGDQGRYWRRCWVWFVGVDRASNHNIHIDQYANGWWELGIGCHCTCKQITIRCRQEPTDDEAREALRRAGWPGLVTR